MYTITLESPGGIGPVIQRSMSSVIGISIIPILKGLCTIEFGMVKPLVLYMGSQVYRVFEQAKPWLYSKVTVVKEED